MKTLGVKTAVPDAPDITTLDTFPNPGVSRIKFKTSEFTSLCPVTGQPDFCTLRIEYYPRTLCIESKSLKLYLQSYRSERGFVESMTSKIFKDLKTVLNPYQLNVEIESVPRGGLTLIGEVWGD